MMVIQAQNVNDALGDGLWYMKVTGKREKTRNGPVKVAPEPVVTCYLNPWERVLFYPGRDPNPFFHLMECIWMMAGSRDVKWLSKYNKQMLAYSDNGKTLNGAYGYRWRRYFGIDQVTVLVQKLLQEQTTRQAVLQMWAGGIDLRGASKDIPCNTHAYFRVQDKRLNMTVCCRSNDMIWGAYGANAVHFSFLHEFLSRACGLKQGLYYQMSNNFHIYKQHWHMLDAPVEQTGNDNPYVKWRLPVIPILQPKESWKTFLLECEDIVSNRATTNPTNHFLKNVVLPMMGVWEHRVMVPMVECDWKVAATDWLLKRRKA